MLKNCSELCNLYKISHTLKLWDIWIKSSELCKLYQITHPEQTEQIELTEQTEVTDIIVLTENLKKCELLTYSLSDNLKSRDASASKKGFVQSYFQSLSHLRLWDLGRRIISSFSYICTSNLFDKHRIQLHILLFEF